MLISKGRLDHLECRSIHLTKVQMLLTRWMDETQPDWRKKARLGGEHPGNYFATKLQAETAVALLEEV